MFEYGRFRTDRLLECCRRSFAGRRLAVIGTTDHVIAGRGLWPANLTTGLALLHDGPGLRYQGFGCPATFRIFAGRGRIEILWPFDRGAVAPELTSVMAQAETGVWIKVLGTWMRRNHH